MSTRKLSSLLKSILGLTHTWAETVYPGFLPRFFCARQKTGSTVAGQRKNSDRRMNRPLSSRQVKKEKLRHEGLVPVSKGSQTL